MRYAAAAAVAAAAALLSLSTPLAAAAAARDWGPLADMVASVLVVREGGVDKALDALPVLHDTTHAYVRTLAIIDAYPKLYGARDAWQGLKNATVDKINALPNATKWWNHTDPLAQKGQELQQALDDKFGPAPPLGWKARYQHTIFDRTVAKVVPDSAQNDPLVAALNEKLAPYNIEVSAKMVMEPTKFSNMAALVAAHFAGVALEASAIEFKPCLISHHVSGAMAGATLLNVAPHAVEIMSQAGMVWPIGVNLQPALLYVSNMGANVQPQGAQVAPYLMAVAPMGVNVQPTGTAITPVNKMVMPVGKQINPVGTSFAPMEHMDMPVKNDITPGGAPHLRHAGHGRKLAAAGAHKITVSDDPLDLSHEFPTDYRNWASILSQVLLHTEGSDAEGAAALDGLGGLILQTQQRLTAAADGEPLLPRFHLNEPMLQSMSGMDHSTMGGMSGMSDMGSMHSMGEGKGMLTKIMATKTFFNFAPCVIHEMKTGAMAKLTGLSFAPSLINIMTDALEARFDGINLNPNLIYVQNMGANVEPQGFNVQPALLYVGPMGVNVQPQGLNVEPKGLSVMPMGVNVQPQGKLIAPVRDMRMPVGTLFAPIENDLTPHQGHDMADHDMAGHDMTGHDAAGHDAGTHQGHVESATASTTIPHDHAAHAPAPAGGHDHASHMAAMVAAAPGAGEHAGH